MNKKDGLQAPGATGKYTLRPRQFRAGLSLKLLIIISFSLIVTISVIGAILINYQEKSLVSEKIKNAEKLAGIVARISAFHIAQYSYFVLDQNVVQLQSRFAKNNGTTDAADILSLVIYDNQGKKLTPSGIPHDRITVPREYWTVLERTCYYKTLLEGTREVGKVVLVFSLQSVYQKTRKVRRYFIYSVIGLILFLGVLMFIIVYVTIIKPVTMLRNSAEQITAHNYDSQVEHGANDEIGDLARSFNRMSLELRENFQRINDKNAELKKLQGQLQEKNISLEEEVGRRTMELERAKTAAEFASKVKTQFLSNRSHEIRTPLNGIIGMITLMEQSRLDKNQEQYLDHLKRSGNFLLNIVNDILDISRIESGTRKIEEKPFRVAEVVETALFPHMQAAREQGLDFRCHIAPDVPDSLIGDTRSLEQILGNLVANAIKFTGEGSIQVTFEKTRQFEGIVTLAVSVSDTGIGIPSEKLDVIFDRFTQLDSTYTKKYAGTGLGLTIVKRLVDIMAGSIHLESEEGKGAHFTVELHFKEDPDTPAEIAPPGKPGEETVSRPGTFHILIAEDNDVNAFFLQTLLKNRGFTVEVAENGVEALEKYGSGHFDLILMDVQMPELNGVECTLRIRELEKETGGHIKIIALTGYAMDDDEEEIMKAGMDEFIAKPISSHLLMDKIRRLLEGK